MIKPFSIIILLFTFFGQMPLFSQNSFELTDVNQRFFFTALKNTRQEIEICGFEKGMDYSVQVIPQNNQVKGKLMLGRSQQETQLGIISFTSESFCQTLSISLEGFPENGELDTWISVALQSNSLQKWADKFPSMEMAPIEVNPNFSATELVEDIFIGGGCFEVSNITQIGADAGLGYFSNGMSSIGLEDGIILASGDVLNAQGPNSGGGTGNSLNQPGDPDLQSLSGVTSNDAHGIEFDFTPTLDEIQFRFAFASDEYCEYVNAGVNDAFGFFISGPGINGPYTGNAANIALIPGTNTAVSINTVNHIQNTNFFKSNSSGCGNPIVAFNDIEYDGMTTVLVATANVIPCETYHIKLVVGDGGDFIFDSAVFLQANSFEAGGDASVSVDNPITGSNVIYEGCGETFIVFERENGSDLSMPLEVEYTIDPASTATPGADYTPLPPIITIPAGQTQVIIPISAFQDGITEGQENIIISLASSCSCESGSAEILIEEAPDLNASMQDIEACGPEVITLSPDIDGGVPLFGYQWSDGSTTPSITVTPNETTTYSVTVSDACGGTAETSSTVTVIEQPTATLSGYGVICNNNNSVEMQVDFTGPGPWDLYYTVNGVIQDPILGITNTPYFFDVMTAGTVSLFSVSTESCEGMVDGTAQIDVTDIQLSIISGDVSCEGGNNGFIFLIPFFGNEPLSYDWSTGDQSQDITDLTAGEYFVTVTDFYGCTAETDVTIEDGPEFIAQTLLYQPVSCYQGNDGAVGVIVTNGGSGSYTYDWSNGGNAPDLTQLSAGLYTVTVTDLYNCVDTVSIELTDPPELNTEIVFADTVDCSNPSSGFIDLEATGGTGGLVYFWNNGAVVQDPTGLEAGLYSVSVTDQNGCIAENSAEIIGDFDLPLIATSVSNILDCNNPETSLDGSGSSTGPGFAYSWTTPDGNIISGDSAIIATANEVGEYTFTVYNQENSCFSQQTVFVTSNFAQPLAEAGSSQQISCADNSITLDGTGSAQGPTFTYSWSTSGGNIVSGMTTLTPLVNAAGWYYLTVEDGLNGCTSIDSVEITQDENLPTVNAGTASTLTCSLVEFQLNGTASTVSGNDSIFWTTVDGNIVSGDTTLTPLINQPGTYQLQVVDLNNGCAAVSSVVVAQDTSAPFIDLSAPDLLDCVTPTIFIDALNSDNLTNFIPAWNTEEGLIIAGDSSLNPQVSMPGTYYLTLYNTSNDCVSFDSVIVVQDIELPIAEAGNGNVLTCDVPELQLDGSASSQGSVFAYNWSTANGLIDLGGDSSVALVSTPGLYELVVTNSQNGCTASDMVEIVQDTASPLLVLAPAAIINCYQPIILLDGGGSSTGAEFSYNWITSNGNLVSGSNSLQAEVDQPGTYSLEITNTINGCSSLASLSVEQDIALPFADAGNSQTIDCAVSSLTLNGSGSVAGSTFTYNWESIDGNIIDGEETLNPNINEPGTYTLTVFNTENGCSSQSETIIFESLDLPAAVASANDILTCTQTSIQLNGGGSAVGDSISYLWTSNTGSIISGDSSLTPIVSAPGSYFLTVFNQSNSCNNTVEVLVIQDIEEPVVIAGASQELTCVINEVSLDGSGSDSGANFEYLWSTIDGNILSGGQSVSPTVNQPGIYTLEVTNTVNGCKASDSVVVTIDANVPQVDAGPDNQLTCAVNSLQLDGTASVVNSNILINWSSPDGNILSGDNTLIPIIDAPGTYTLTLQDTSNSCTAFESVIISQDILSPTVLIGQPGLLTCSQNSLQLDATASDNGSNYSYNWTTNNGVIISGQQTLEPIIGASGQYDLTILNNQNGCSSTSAVTVNQDLDVPFADAGDIQLLTCSTTEVTIGGSGSSTGLNYEYSWSTATGNFTSAPNQLFVDVNQPGSYQLVVTDNSNGCTAIATVEINQDIQAPQPVLSNPATLTCDVLTSSIQVTPNTSNGNPSFSWSTLNGNITGPVTNQIITVDAPGNYTCVVTDVSNGCTATITEAVAQNIQPPLTDAGQSPTITCAEPTVSLDGGNSASGNHFYSWSTLDGNILSGFNGLTPEVDEPGTYTLVVTDNANGCTASDQVIVAINTLEPTASAGMTDLLTCAITSLTLDGSGSSQGPVYEYNWTTIDGNIVSGTNSISPLINQPGTYQLIVTNTQNGCTATDNVLITEDTQLPSPVINAPQGLTLTCAVDEISLTGASSQPSGSLNFLWSTNNGNIIGNTSAVVISLNTGGNYQLQVSNTQNGCSASTSVNVGVDTVAPYINIAPPPAITCLSPEVSIDAGNSSSGPGISYVWTASAGGTIVGGAGTNQITAGAAGAYSLTIQDANNGCTATAAVNVSEDIVLPTVVVNASGILNCNQPEVIVSAYGSNQGPDYTYSWETVNGQISGATNELQATVTQTGIYSITVFNIDNGCENTASVEVFENDNLPTGIIYDLQVPVCFGEEGIIEVQAVENGTGPYQFSFDGGDTYYNGFGELYLESGTYDIIVQDAFGCTFSETFFIPTPPELSVVAVEPEVKVELGETAQLKAQVNFSESLIDTIIWSPQRYLSCTDCLDPIVESAGVNTPYTIQIRTTDGCLVETTIFLRVIEKRDIFIPNAFTPFDNDGKNDLLLVYANERQVTQINRFELFDRWGERVFADFNFQPNDPSHSWDGFHRGREVNPGVYVYIAEIEFVDGEVLVYKGSVTVVR